MLRIIRLRKNFGVIWFWSNLFSCNCFALSFDYRLCTRTYLLHCHNGVCFLIFSFVNCRKLPSKMITVRILSCSPKEKKGLTRSIPVLRLKSQSSYIVSSVPPFCFHDYGQKFMYDPMKCPERPQPQAPDEATSFPGSLIYERPCCSCSSCSSCRSRSSRSSCSGGKLL